MRRSTKLGFAAAATAVLLFAAAVAVIDRSTAHTGATSAGTSSDGDAAVYPGQLGENSAKIRHRGARTYVWADGPMTKPGGVWFDFTGAPFPPEDLQFGIGRDTIRAIDDPLFVHPDDPRLLTLAPDPYRPPPPLGDVNDLPVIGVEIGGEPKAYPVVLLTNYELVNDVIGGRPVTVGW